MRKCPKCGADVELVCLAGTGQRVLVVPQVVPMFVGTESGGGISLGRILHDAVCPGSPNIEQGVYNGVIYDGAWKSKSQKQQEYQIAEMFRRQVGAKDSKKKKGGISSTRKEHS